MLNPHDFPRSELCSTPFTIPSGQAVSSTLDLFATSLVSIICPAAWDAASLSVDASLDGVTFYPMANVKGILFAPIVVAGYWLCINPADFASGNCFRFRSGTSGSPVNQSAARVFTAITRPLN